MFRAWQPWINWINLGQVISPPTSHSILPHVVLLFVCVCFFNKNFSNQLTQVFLLVYVLVSFVYLSSPQLDMETNQPTKKTRTYKPTKPPSRTLWGIRFTHMAILGATSWSWEQQTRLSWHSHSIHGTIVYLPTNLTIKFHHSCR